MTAQSRSTIAKTGKQNVRLSYFAIVSLLWPFVFAGGCKSPFDRTRDASGGGGTGAITGSGNLVVFSNELKTGGGAFLYPSGENQALSFNDTSNPISARSIRYTWNGQDVGGQHIFTGFDLMHTATQADYTPTRGRDLRAANYTKVTFYARGSLSANTFMKVEVADDGDPTTPAPCVALSPRGDLDDLFPATPCGRRDTITSDWRQYTIPISNSNLNPVKDFFKGTFVFLPGGGNIPGGGGTVYFDNIQYAP